LKILHLIETLGVGGAEQALVNLLPSLRRRGHHCEVAALWGPYDLSDSLEAEGLRVHRLKIRYRRNIAQAVMGLLPVIRVARPDVLHMHLFFATLYGGLTKPLFPGLRRVVTFHNLGYEFYPVRTAPQKLRRLLEAIITRHWIDGAVGVSAAVAEHYRYALGLTSVAVIPNAINVGARYCGDLQSRQLRAKFDLSERDFVIATVGVLRKEKGHRFLVEALQILAAKALRPKVLIVGPDRLAGAIHQQVRHCGLSGQVIMTGELPHAEALAITAAADLFVTASLSEGLGIAAAEAMDLGLPVVATDVGGLRDLIEDGVSGLLVPAADAGAVAKSIERLMNDSLLRAHLAQAAQARIAANFSPEIVASRWEDFYRSLLDGPRQVDHPV